MPARAGLVMLVLLSLGHFFVDLYSGALGALQPLLVERFRLSLTQAGILGGLLVFSSSVIQPAYGYLSDRIHWPVLAALGPAMAGVFISSLGLAPSYLWLGPLVFLGGAGVAAFHPQASAICGYGMEEKRARIMAVFISAGTLGYALGPTYFSLFAGRFGLRHTFWAGLPGVAVSLLLVFFLPGVCPARPRSKPDWAVLRKVWRPLAILYTLVFIRSIVQVTFGQFIPLYLHLERGFTPAQASYTLSLYLAAGALGGFVGGNLSDRFGNRRIILISMIVSVPFLSLFFLTSGPISITGLLIGGLILLFTIPVNVVMAQELAPSQAGTVSALMMGFAWGMAGLLFIPLTGWAADRFSIHSVLFTLSLTPILGFLLALRLPK